MGQQQLLFTVLVTIVVGFAVIVGVRLSSQQVRVDREQRISLEVLELAGRAQAWYRRPTLLDGGNGSFAAVSLPKLDWPTQTEIARYQITDQEASQFTLSVASFGSGAAVVDGASTKMRYVVRADSILGPVTIND